MMLKNLGETKVTVRDLVLVHELIMNLDFHNTVDTYSYCIYGVVAIVGVALGNAPGVVAGIRPAFTSAGSFVVGLLIPANVTPASTLVSPIIGGSPFFANSYNPWPQSTSISTRTMNEKHTRHFIPS